MADTMTANNVYQFPVEPAPAKPARASLWDRVRNVGQSLKAIATTPLNKDTLEIAADKLGAATKAVGGFLKNRADQVKNMTVSDWKWVGANVAVGAATKLAVGAAIGATGGSALLIGLAGATAAGAAVGLTRAYREYRKEQAFQPATSPFDKYAPVTTNRFFTRKTLMTSVSSAAISAATFGVLSGVEHATGWNPFQSLANIFNKTVDRGMAFIAESDFMKEQVARELGNGFDMTNGLAQKNAAVKYEAFKPTRDVVPGVVEGKSGHAGIDSDIREAALNSVKPKAVPVAAAIPATPAVAPVAPAAPATPPVSTSAKGVDIGKAMPKLPPQPDGASIDIKGNDGVTRNVYVQKPNAAAELANVQSQQRQQFMEDHLRGLIAKDMQPAPGTSLLDMAKMIVPRNPDAYLNALKEQALKSAPVVDGSKMAAACVADIPKTPAELSARGGFTANACNVVKPDMENGDFVIVRDAHTPGRNGLRVLFRDALDAIKEKTISFTDVAVSREAIPDMTEQAMAAEATRLAAEESSRQIVLAAQSAAILDATPTP